MSNDNNCNKKHIPEPGRGFTVYDCGDELSAHAVEGCYKLHESAWLEEYPDNIPTDIFEVRFKNTRRSFYRNVNNLPLKRGDIVAVEASPGHDIGIISLTGVAVCGAAGAALGKLTFSLTPEAWGCAAACALLVSIGGSALLQAGVRRVGDANASIYSLLEPITSILFGMLLLSETFTPRKALSCGLILLGLLLTALCDRRETKEGRDVP